MRRLRNRKKRIGKLLVRVLAMIVAVLIFMPPVAVSAASLFGQSWVDSNSSDIYYTPDGVFKDLCVGENETSYHVTQKVYISQGLDGLLVLEKYRSAQKVIKELLKEKLNVYNDGGSDDYFGTSELFCSESSSYTAFIGYYLDDDFNDAIYYFLQEYDALCNAYDEWGDAVSKYLRDGTLSELSDKGREIMEEWLGSGAGLHGASLYNNSSSKYSDVLSYFGKENSSPSITTSTGIVISDIARKRLRAGDGSRQDSFENARIRIGLSEYYVFPRPDYEETVEYDDVPYTVKGRDDILKQYEDILGRKDSEIREAVSTMQELSLTLYNNIGNASSSAILNGQYMEKEEEPETIEKSFSEFLRGISISLENLLAEGGASLDSIIYGRVNTGSFRAVSNNYYSFELVDGNVYGVIGAAVYGILRGCLLLGFVLAIAFFSAKGSFTSSAKAYFAVKDNIAHVIIVTVLVAFIPNILDALIYFRDLLLRIVGPTLSAFLGEGTEKVVFVSASEMFYEQAEQSETFVDACMYFGSIALIIYYAFTYVAMACAMTIMFAFFPLFALVSFKDRKVLDNWTSFMIGCIATPLVDAVLYILPIMASTEALHVPTLVKFILCMSLLPARATVRQMLGMGHSIGAEMVGVGSLVAMGSAVRSVASTVRGAAGHLATGVKGFARDQSEANALDKLSEADAGVNDTLQERFGFALGEDQAAREGGRSVIGAAAVPAGVGGSMAATTRTPNLGGRAAFLDPDTDLDRSRQAALDSVATIKNLDNPVMKNISPQRRAELLRERSWVNLASETAKGVGMAHGGVVGGVVGFGASTFFSPSARMSMTGMGVELGGAVGETAGGLVMPAAQGGLMLGRAGAAVYDKFVPENNLAEEGDTDDVALDSEDIQAACDKYSSDMFASNEIAARMRLEDPGEVERTRNFLDNIFSREGVSEKDIITALNCVGDVCNRNGGYRDGSTYSPDSGVGAVLNEYIGKAAKKSKYKNIAASQSEFIRNTDQWKNMDPGLKLRYLGKDARDRQNELNQQVQNETVLKKQNEAREDIVSEQLDRLIADGDNKTYIAMSKKAKAFTAKALIKQEADCENGFVSESDKFAKKAPVDYESLQECFKGYDSNCASKYRKNFDEKSYGPVLDKVRNSRAEDFEKEIRKVRAFTADEYRKIPEDAPLVRYQVARDPETGRIYHADGINALVRECEEELHGKYFDANGKCTVSREEYDKLLQGTAITKHNNYFTESGRDGEEWFNVKENDYIAIEGLAMRLLDMSHFIFS